MRREIPTEPLVELLDPCLPRILYRGIKENDLILYSYLMNDGFEHKVCLKMLLYKKCERLPHLGLW